MTRGVERTAVVRRVVDVVRGRGDVTVVGHACPWRDDLVEVLAGQLPGQSVGGSEAVPDDAGATVWLELSAGDAGFQRAETGGRWLVGPDDAVEGVDVDPPAGADVAFVPVSGVRPPRRLRFFFDQGTGVIWDDENLHLGDLEDLLPIGADLRAEVKAWNQGMDEAGGRVHGGLRRQQRRLAARLAEVLADEFVVDR